MNQYFNDSTGIGDRGEPDARGPWNEGGDWEFVNAPAFQEFMSPQAGTRAPNGGNGSTGHNGDADAATSKRGGQESKTRRHTSKSVKTK